MPFENEIFDAVICLQGLQYFPDCAAALREISRVTKRGGRFVAVVERALVDRTARPLTCLAPSGSLTAPRLRNAFDGDTACMCPLLAASGFRDVETLTGSTASRFPSVRHFIDAFAVGSLSSRAAIAKVREEGRAAFYEEVDLRRIALGVEPA